MACFAGCFGGAKLDLKTPKKLVYFGLATPVALPSMILMELSGKDYEGKIVGFDEWAKLKPTVPHGKLPYAEMPNGFILVESGAIARTIAGSCNKLGHGEDFSMSELLVGMGTDLNKAVFDIAPTIMTLKDFNSAKYKHYVEKAPDVKKMAGNIAQFLKPSGDRFTSTGVTFGEIDLFSKMYCYRNGPLKDFGAGTLDKFYDRMLKIPAVKKVVDGESKFGKLGFYMIAPPQLK
eukprot:TRINITY_DN57747_c0_g1_i1.p1 TRINITY_DN57747_c0_g1~~TRINITY_DN57747_c0_g1_i1.p1  ORF type:complete len:234 (-),score=77.39 TRINITY_DN57747_c0_g1_i1:98-799(-)